MRGSILINIRQILTNAEFPGCLRWTGQAEHSRNQRVCHSRSWSLNHVCVLNEIKTPLRRNIEQCFVDHDPTDCVTRVCRQSLEKVEQRLAPSTKKVIGFQPQMNCRIQATAVDLLNGVEKAIKSKTAIVGDDVFRTDLPFDGRIPFDRVEPRGHAALEMLRQVRSSCRFPEQLMNDPKPLAANSVAIANPREPRRRVKRVIFAFVFWQTSRFDSELGSDDGHAIMERGLTCLKQGGLTHTLGVTVENDFG